MYIVKCFGLSLVVPDHGTKNAVSMEVQYKETLELASMAASKTESSWNQHRGGGSSLVGIILRLQHAVEEAGNTQSNHSDLVKTCGDDLYWC